jgi:hypothetical protein
MTYPQEKYSPYFLLLSNISLPFTYDRPPFVSQTVHFLKLAQHLSFSWENSLDVKHFFFSNVKP